VDDAPKPEARRIGTDTSDSGADAIPDNDDGSGEDAESGEEATCLETFKRTIEKGSRLKKEMRWLNTYYNPMTRDTMNVQTVAHRSGDKDAHTAGFCFNAVYKRHCTANTEKFGHHQSRPS
jgi:hypothetical protein